MHIQKRPFILIEVFLAIALLSLCAFPLISSSLRSFYSQKKSLLKLELERHAELYFYQVLKKDVSSLNYDKISHKTSLWTPFKDLKLSFDGINQTYYPHYHLYWKKSDSPTHKKISCDICFPTKKDYCPNNGEKENKNFRQKPYKFYFLIKKVAEKAVDAHVKTKEKNLKNHEKSSSDIQTLCPSK